MDILTSRTGYIQFTWRPWVPVTLHAIAVPGEDNDTLDGGHFVIKRLISEKIVRSVGGGRGGVSTAGERFRTSASQQLEWSVGA